MPILAMMLRTIPAFTWSISDWYSMDTILQPPAGSVLHSTWLSGTIAINVTACGMCERTDTASVS